MAAGLATATESAAVGAVDSKVVDLVYPASADRATVATTLQKDVRQILVEAGLTVSNSQILAVREEDAFDYIGLKLTATGDIAALDAALSAIAGYLPVLLVEELDIWPQRTGSRGGEAQQQELSVSLQLLSLRASQ